MDSVSAVSSLVSATSSTNGIVSSGAISVLDSTEKSAMTYVDTLLASLGVGPNVNAQA